VSFIINSFRLILFRQRLIPGGTVGGIVIDAASDSIYQAQVPGGAFVDGR
jgi:hypothetical protein